MKAFAERRGMLNVSATTQDKLVALERQVAALNAQLGQLRMDATRTQAERNTLSERVLDLQARPAPPCMRVTRGLACLEEGLLPLEGCGPCNAKQCAPCAFLRLV